MKEVSPQAKIQKTLTNIILREHRREKTVYDSINIQYKPRQTVSAARSVTLGVESTDGKGTRVRIWGSC